MARLSKSHHFKIFEDTGIPTPPGDQSDPFDETNKSSRPSTSSSVRGPLSKHDLAHDTYDPPSDADADDEDPLPRDSLTSVSSFPSSTSHRHDVDFASPPPSPQKFFTPQIIRPSFRRPESVRRMQMSSPRQSILSQHHRSAKSSRSGTPRSEYERGSPRGRGRRITEEWVSEEERDCVGKESGREHPLVLLQVTLLPIEMRWSMENMQELLPPQVLESLLLLRSKVSETVLQRGILIPHPREEYEMLEERLLEALELKEERLTKCGHFRGRTSDASQASSSGDSDSGLGSSESSSSDDGEFCATCRHHVRCPAGKTQKWSVKVFAANGMMRASAWAAAWDGMESVDVEILPWVGEEESRRLDMRREEEERIQRKQWVEEERKREESRATEMMKGGLLLREQEEEAYGGSTGDPTRPDGEFASVATTMHQRQPGNPVPDAVKTDELPAIYKKSQVPLSVLLRNYLYLLAQDHRNVAVFFLGMFAIVLAARSMLPSHSPALTSVGYSTPLESAPTVQETTMQGGQSMPQMDHDGDEVPSVLESVAGTLSQMLSDEDEAIFEDDGQTVAPPGGDPEAGDSAQPVIPQDEAVQETEHQKEGSPGVLESVAETISQMLSDEDEAFFEDDGQPVVPAEEDTEANGSARQEDLADGMGEKDEMLE